MHREANFEAGQSGQDADMAFDGARIWEWFGQRNKSEPLTMDLQLGTYENGSTIPPMQILENVATGETTIASYTGARAVENMLRWAMYDFDADKNGILSASELNTAYGTANKHVHPYMALPLQFASNNISAFARLSRDGDDGKAGITQNDIEQISNYDSYFTKQAWLTKNPNSWWYFLMNPSVKAEYKKLFEQINSKF